MSLPTEKSVIHPPCLLSVFLSSVPCPVSHFLPPSSPLPGCLMGTLLTQDILSSPSVRSLFYVDRFSTICVHVANKSSCFNWRTEKWRLRLGEEPLIMLLVSSYRAKDDAARPSLFSPHSDWSQHVAWPQGTKVYSTWLYTHWVLGVFNGKYGEIGHRLERVGLSSLCWLIEKLMTICIWFLFFPFKIKWEKQ